MEAGKGKACVAAAFVLAGSSVVAARYVVGFVGPFTVALLSLSFAVVTAVLVSGRGMLDGMRRLSGRRWLFLFLQALFGIFLFRVFIALAAGLTGAAGTGIVTGTAPAVTAVLALIFLREPLSRRRVAGIVVALAGVLALNGLPPAAEPPAAGEVTGTFLALCATACEGVFAVLSRKMHLADPDGGEGLRPIPHAGIVGLLALGMCLAPALRESPFAPVAALPATAWLALAWYGAIATVAAYAFMFAGAKRCDGYVISAFTALIPLSALVLSVLVLGEPMAPGHWLGAGCILASILFIREERPALPSTEVAAEYPPEL